jgi:hypothetical protein
MPDISNTPAAEPDRFNDPDYGYNQGLSQQEELALAGFTDEETRDQSKHPYDFDEVTLTRYRRLNGWYKRERQLQGDFRIEQMKDHKFYDGDQWEEDDRNELKQRGQKATVFNQIKPTCDWVIGTEKRTRIDYMVLPRGKEDRPLAETKTKILKYVSDVSKEQFHRSRAFEDSVKSGLGWLEAGVKSDVEDEPVFVRWEDWRNIWWDTLHLEPDYSDARYLFRSKWVDFDVAASMFPDRLGIVKLAVQKDDLYWQEEDQQIDVDPVEGEAGFALELSGDTGITTWSRNRVRLIEAWYKEPMRGKVLKDGSRRIGTLNGVVYDEKNEDHAMMVNEGLASTVDAIRMGIRVMIFCSRGILHDGPTPYNHNRFPFVPIWANRKKVDNSPYGMIRQLRDPQEDLNKRRSKALHILNTRQVVADENATEDWDDIKAEVDRPDGLIRVKPGTRFDFSSDTQLANEHVMLMNQDAEYIERTGGVNDEMMGRQTNAVSGKAITARQELGTTLTMTMFDNLRLAFQLIGELKLSLVEQFYTEEKTIRIQGAPNQWDFVDLNFEDPETGEMLNDITASQADFVIDSQNFTANMRQAAFEQLTSMLEKLPPELAMAMLDIIVEMSDVPMKETLVQRIREITGQKDPSKDPEDPEEVAKEQAKAEAEAKQQQLLEAIQMLEIRLKEAQAEKLETDAAKTSLGMEVEADKTGAEVEKIESETMSIESSVELADEELAFKKTDAAAGRQIERAKVLADIEQNKRMAARPPIPASKPAAKKPAKKG